MQRYFTNNKEDDYFILSSDDIYHIQKVMRMKKNDMIEIVYDKNVYLCEIDSIKPFTFKKIKLIDENNENKRQIIVVQSLVNENKMDYILQKCTELGMSSFYAYKAVNSIIKTNDKIDNKMKRWQKIVKEASEQSKRNVIPDVKNIIDLNTLLKIEADLKILLSVNEDKSSVKKVLQENSKCDTIMIVVGPEGGFTKDEEEQMIDNGFLRVSLGKRVLRTETAALVALSMINYEWMV